MQSNEYQISDIEYIDMNYDIDGIKWVFDNCDDIEKDSFKLSFNHFTKNYNGKTEIKNVINIILPNMTEFNLEQLVDIFKNDHEQIKFMIENNDKMNVINIVNHLIKTSHYYNDNLKLLKMLIDEYNINITHVVNQLLIHPRLAIIKWIFENYENFDKYTLGECLYALPYSNSVQVIQFFRKHIDINWWKLKGVCTNDATNEYIDHIMSYNIDVSQYYEYANNDNFEEFKYLYESQSIELTNNKILEIFVNNKNIEAIKWICREIEKQEQLCL